MHKLRLRGGIMSDLTPTQRVMEESVPYANYPAGDNTQVVNTDFALQLAAELEQCQKERDELKEQLRNNIGLREMSVKVAVAAIKSRNEARKIADGLALVVGFYLDPIEHSQEQVCYVIENQEKFLAAYTEAKKGWL